MQIKYYNPVAFPGICAMLISLIFISSCATPYSGPSTATGTIDIQITTDPPGANINSLQRMSSSSADLRFSDFAYDKYGPGKHEISTTPYRTYIGYQAQRMGDGSDDYMWRSDMNLWGGDSIMLLKLSQRRNQSTFYTDYYGIVTIEFVLELEGYESEPVSINIAEGRAPLRALLDQASATPVIIHRVLRPIR